MEIHLKIFVLLLLLYRIECVKFVVVAPNVLRWDTEETVIVTLEGNQRAHVELYMQDLPYMRNKFSAKRKNNAGNRKVEEFTMKVRVTDFPENKDGWEENQYVRLNAKVGNEVYSTDILMTSIIANVFVQTDKPIYTPEQTVLIAVYTTDLDNLPKKMPIRLDLVSPTGLSVDRTGELMTEYKLPQGSMPGMFQHKFVLPRSPVHGNWSVVASYGPTDRGDKTQFTENTTAIFEVKEYVLPSFSCKLQGLKNFIYKETEESFSGKVLAKYNHGAPMSGTVNIKFGIVDEKMIKYFHTTKNLKLVDGESDFFLSVKDTIYASIPNFDLHLKDKRLMVHATCFEAATGDMQEVKNSQAFFVITPFVFNFEQTRAYFKPGLKTVVQFQLLYKNGQPAVNRELEIEAIATDIAGQYVALNLNQENDYIETTDDRGWIRMQFNTQDNLNKIKLKFKVPRSDKPHEPKKVQHEQDLTLEQTKLSKDIVITLVSQTPLPVDQEAKIEIFFKGAITELTWLVLSRGCILSSDKRTVDDGGSFGNSQVLHIIITKEMVPSARLVVFFLSSDGFVGGDSLWIDVEDKCQDQHKIQVKVMNHGSHLTDDNPITHNGKPKSLTVDVEWTQNATVALQMVDRAVHTLNDRTTLTPKSMWHQLNALDTGCGGGGGENTGQMFSHSGLAVASGLRDTATTRKINTKARMTYKCTTKYARMPRMRRQAEDTDTSVLGLADCCALGTQGAGDWTGCERMVARYMWPAGDDINTYTATCLNAIKECCRNSSSPPAQGETDDERSMTAQDEDDFNAAIQEAGIRDKFPESMFLGVADLTRDIDGVGHGSVQFNMPDTITSWAVEAVGLHATSGLCVLPSTQFTVKKEKYIKVRLPYRAVRGEHLNARITFYNFDDESTDVGIYMRGVDGVCSKAKPGRFTKRVDLTVSAKKAKTISFPIVPMKVGDVKIGFYAVRGKGPSGKGRKRKRTVIDAVEKKLTIVAEGVTKTKEVTFVVDLKPHAALANECKSTGGQKNEVKCDVSIKTPRFVEDSVFGRIRIVGNMFGAAVDIVLKDLSHTLRQPAGCGEQVMIRIAPGVYAYKYMKLTNSMTGAVQNKLPGIVSNAVKYLDKYHKANGGFGVWEDGQWGSNHDAKVWLTSFIIKVFSAANEFVGNRGMDQYTLNKAINYVYSQQVKTGNDKGKFKEKDGKVHLHHGEMIGAVSHKDLTLTAYIAAGLCEADPNLQIPIHRSNIGLTFDYLARNIHKQNSPYEKALVAYALSFSPYKNTRPGQEAFRILKQAVESDTGSRLGYFPERTKAIQVETVAYAILTALRYNEFNYCYPMVFWLHRQRTDGGKIFSSTQDTVLALQALAEYAIAMEEYGRTDLSVYVDGAEDKTKANFNIDESMKNLEFIVELKKDKVLYNQPFSVTVHGQGMMQVTVEIQYNSEDHPPSGFDVEVDKEFKTEEKVLGGGVDYDDYGDYDGDYDGGEDEEVVTTTMEMTIKAKCKACGKTGMAIIEVGLLSGFTAKEDSLEKLLRNEQIDSYEVTNAMVIMYLKEIREDRASIVSFSAIQEHTVEHISPAVIKIYDYYNRSNNFMTFYNTSGIPKTEARNDDNQRECVEGRCSKCYGPGQSELLPIEDFIPIEDFKVKACDPSITFAYMVKALGTDYNSPDFVETTLKIIKVAKKGKVNVWEQMEIIMRRRITCDCPTFGNNGLFFIYGKDEPQEPNGVDGYYMLPVNSDTYVEPRNAVRHQELINFLELPCRN